MISQITTSHNYDSNNIESNLTLLRRGEGREGQEEEGREEDGTGGQMREESTFRMVPLRAPSGLSAGSVGPRTFPRKSISKETEANYSRSYVCNIDTS